MQRDPAQFSAPRFVRFMIGQSLEHAKASGMGIMPIPQFE
jgi:hypothetical protein